MNKKISLGLALSLIAIAVAVTFILTSFFSLQSFNKKVVDVNDKARRYDSLESLDTFVRDNYFGEIDERDLSDGILKGYVDGLDDKYSRYLTEEEYINEMSEEAGQLVGLGLTLSEDESGYVRIDGILQDSPLYNSGLQEGDIITFVDGVDVLQAGFDDSVEAMRGTEGSQIVLTVRRDGVDTDYTFTRQAIEVTTVTGEMLDGFVGYVKITKFKQNTPQQFIDTLEHLTANGAKSIVFDLRDNTGGLVSALEECLDPLLPEGVIATAEYKDGHTETIVYSDETELDLPMVVLVNGNTASAAELFAASLRDYGKAQLVGVKTYGKGVMQSTTEMGNGGAVVLTIAEYKTSRSDCYDGEGLTPDYQVENEDENYDAQLATASQLARTAESGE